MDNTSIGPQLMDQLQSTHNVNEIAAFIAVAKDAIGIVTEFIKFGNKYCEEIKKENKKLYEDSIQPLQIANQNIEKELQDPTLTLEQKKPLLVMLVQNGKDIFERGDKIKQYSKDELVAHRNGIIKGASVTALAGALLLAVLKLIKK